MIRDAQGLKERGPLGPQQNSPLSTSLPPSCTVELTPLSQRVVGEGRATCPAAVCHQRGWSPHLADQPPAKRAARTVLPAPATGGQRPASATCPWRLSGEVSLAAQFSGATSMQGARRGVCVWGVHRPGQTGTSWSQVQVPSFWKPLTAGPGVSSSPEGVHSRPLGSRTPPLQPGWLPA